MTSALVTAAGIEPACLLAMNQQLFQLSYAVIKTGCRSLPVLNPVKVAFKSIADAHQLRCPSPSVATTAIYCGTLQRLSNVSVTVILHHHLVMSAVIPFPAFFIIFM